MTAIMSDQINELAKALSGLQTVMENAKKSSENPHYKSSYADLAEVRNAIRPHLKPHGLSYTQVTVTDDSGNVTLVTMLMHDSGQWVRSVWPIRPVQNSPQGSGSALTFGRRYTLAGVFGLASEGEDDDGNAASHTNGNGNHTNAPTKPPVKKPEPQGPLFATPELRATYVRNTVDAFAAAVSLEKLEQVQNASTDKLAAMKASANQLDKDAFATILKAYKEAKAQFAVAPATVSQAINTGALLNDEIRY